MSRHLRATKDTLCQTFPHFLVNCRSLLHIWPIPLVWKLSITISFSLDIVAGVHAPRKLPNSTQTLVNDVLSTHFWSFSWFLKLILPYKPTLLYTCQSNLGAQLYKSWNFSNIWIFSSMYDFWRCFDVKTLDLVPRKLL
jgi:hypothetical protein